MATVATTSQDQPEILPPPTERFTALGWLRKNLFNTWFDSILTIGFSLLTFWLLFNFMRWATTTAEWDVIPANLNLILRGRYPGEYAGRIWLALFILAAVVGLCWGTWGRRIQTETVIVYAIPIALLFVPFFSTETRINLLIIEGIAIVAFAIGRFGPIRQMNRLALFALFIYFPIMILVLRGWSGEVNLGLFGQEATFNLLPQTWDIHITTADLWGGLVLSLILAAVGIVFSFPLGILLALGRRSELPAIRMLCVIYIEFIRGVPLISLLFMALVMLQLFLPPDAPRINAVFKVAVAIILFSGAYVAENVRGGLQSIPRGQAEAAHALGLSQFQTMTRIILPQALRAIIPVTVSQFIGLFKDTSLVAYVGLFDLLGIARAIPANPDWQGTHREVFIFVASLYWIFCYAMSFASRRLERALNIDER